MQIVAGLNLSNLKPKIWVKDSPYHLPNLQAVMISYADFDRAPRKREWAMKQGLHTYLNVPENINIYLDNGAFSFLKKEKEIIRDEYEEFVEQAKPNWYPIPQDYIPAPKMSDKEQLHCLNKTMQVNQDYRHDGFVPVIHISRCLDQYLEKFQTDEQLMKKERIALGAIVPNLLRMPKAMKPQNVLESVRKVRDTLSDKELHVFGVGGTSTLHLAALLGVDSVDSSGWRNRAARGIIQLPGKGDRIVADLGSWRGRRPDKNEWEDLINCLCPACKQFGLDGLKKNGIEGFCNRATHNLWILLDEVRQIDEHIQARNYSDWYLEHVQNSTYLPLIQQTVGLLEDEKEPPC